MSLLDWWRKPAVPLDESLQQRLAALPPPAPPAACNLRGQRWVVVDVETTGLDLQRDEVLAIGAVVIEDGAIDFSQQFEQTFLHTKPCAGPSVLFHGLGPSALAAGREPAEVLVEFLEFVGDSPLLAFHAPFDQRMLARAFKQHLGHRWEASLIDVAELAPLLLPDIGLRGAGLDQWAERFGLQAGERHHAAADALVTAELMLILLSHARRQGLDSPQHLLERLGQWRRRQLAPGL
ncbi:3'-5' exonuclease [Pseudomonas sp. HR96]|uniref:3'-5' exonuclease n=1 Tax=Pseudomonas sp. HR96 TaxID=1027966 RepID=UPI002A74C2EC|nr:3'-5' exonuclease [Pseudomonas sp. HR96]WPP00317.1 3'-5' exonuclease [Pseudomonas sp. HR96]